MGREETTFRLFFSYPFSHQYWRHLNINWNFDIDFYSMMSEARGQFNSDLFIEVFMIVVWLIWKQKNDHIFNRVRPPFDRWKSGFLSEAFTQAYRMSSPKKDSFFILLDLYR
jgi:hypothetical protein